MVSTSDIRSTNQESIKEPRSGNTLIIQNSNQSRLDEKAFRENLKTDEVLRNLLYIFAIAHKAKLKSPKYESHIAEEASLAGLASDFGVKFKSKIENLEDTDTLSSVLLENTLGGPTKVEYYLINEHDRSRYN